MMPEKILVIGRGFLGEQLMREITDSKKVPIGTQFTTIEDNNELRVDIRDTDSILRCVLRFKPDVIVNCAANVNLDFLENNKELAFAVNSLGAKNVARVAERERIRLIHISTDGIFDGARGMYVESDLPNPINVYGKSKLLGEQFVKDSCENHVIVRTNFYGIDRHGKHLLSWVLSSLKEKKEIIGFDDIIFTPLEVSNLCKMIIEVSSMDYKGILHLASNEAISKYNFALAVADAFCLNKDLIKKGTSNDVKLVARRPKNTSLSNKKSKELLRTKIIPIKDSLKKLSDLESRIQ
jgi:dTDP-4-dehydrorhamnose reductase